MKNSDKMLLILGLFLSFIFAVILLTYFLIMRKKESEFKFLEHPLLTICCLDVSLNIGLSVFGILNGLSPQDAFFSKFKLAALTTLLVIFFLLIRKKK